MNVSEYTSLINKPDAIDEKQTEVLEKIAQEFPYFQSARALYLKGLYNQNSFKYNYALKITAAHTADRSVLFDFITSDAFVSIHKSEPTSEIIESEISVENETVVEAPKLEARENTIEQSIAASIRESLPVEKYEDENHALETETASVENNIDTENPLPVAEIESGDISETTFAEPQEIRSQTEETTTASISEKLDLGKPLAFSLAERHSFQEWLQLSKFKPIVRDEETQSEPDVSSEIPEMPQSISEVNFGKQKKNELIDRFIETSPKIPALKNEMPLPGTFYEPSKADTSFLMTETLARVYLEQKKYKKAIQAYEILILKYPEKISFFADRILDIQNLQQNNT